MYAVIETGSKQYRVTTGETVDVEKLAGEVGDQVELERVLLVGGEAGTTVGTPTVAGARVVAMISDQFRDDKKIVFKFKAKKHYRRKLGHRQSLTRLTIREIIA